VVLNVTQNFRIFDTLAPQKYEWHSATTGMRRVTTFRSTTDRMYDSGPIRLWYYNTYIVLQLPTVVFLNLRALASIILGRERPEETTKCYKISLVQLITNLDVILYL